MELTRTANAGILLKLDGVSILLDGVCREEYPYPATPPGVKADLMAELPDAVAFTHAHNDHYDPDFAAYALQKNGVILGPADCCGTLEPITVGTVKITPVSSRHIGAAGKTTSHVSFIIEGSQCVWFTGDCSPLFWKGKTHLPAPDVMFAPYAYAATHTTIELVKELGAKKLVILHLPKRTEDPYQLWSAVENTLKQGSGMDTSIPDLGQTISL